MSQINPPRGMRDFLPTDKRRREQVLAIIRDTYAGFGFDEIETPAMEERGRLGNSEGGDNQKMTFEVLRRRLKPAEIESATDSEALVDMGLRYDLTVPLSRFYATNRGQLPTTFRSLQVGPVWRAERPQRGRYRQFMQCDIDIVGEPGVLAEAELLQATAAALTNLGVDNWRFRLNSREFLTALLTKFGVEPELQPRVLIELDKMDKLKSVTGVMSLLNLLPLSPTSLGDIEDYLQDVTELYEESPGGLDDLNALVPDDLAESVEALRILLTSLPAALRARVVFDPLLIRGMGYYTGAVYEIEIPGLGYSIGGGGRYDGMIGRLSGTDAPAVGMSLGFERLIDLVNLTPTETTRVVLAYDRDVAVSDLLRFKNQLVAEGAQVRLEKRPKKLPELLTRLAAEGFTLFASVRADTNALMLKPLTQPQHDASARGE